MIMLSTVYMHWLRDLLVSILGFWPMTINGLVLPEAMVGPTLHDVAAILNLPIYGEELPPLYKTCCSTTANTFSIKFTKDDFVLDQVASE